jgi:hypothetical protein
MNAGIDTELGTAPSPPLRAASASPRPRAGASGAGGRGREVYAK